jgi:hypothetical protein
MFYPGIRKPPSEQAYEPAHRKHLCILAPEVLVWVRCKP